MPRNTQAGRPKRHPEPVRARIGQPRDRDEVETSAPYADVWCGRCGQKLPGLVRVGPRDPLVQAGFATAGDVVLSRPQGWRWENAVWRLTRRAERELERMNNIARIPAGWERSLMGDVAGDQEERRTRIARQVVRETRVGQEPSPDYPGFDYDAFLQKAGRGLVLPATIECPGRSCPKVLNVIDCSAPH